MKRLNDWSIWLSDKSVKRILVILLIVIPFVIGVFILGHNSDEHNQQWYRRLVSEGKVTQGTIISWKKIPKGGNGKSPGSWPFADAVIAFTDTNGKSNEFTELVTGIGPDEGHVGQNIPVFFIMDNGVVRAASALNGDVIQAENYLRGNK